MNRFFWYQKYIRKCAQTNHFHPRPPSPSTQPHSYPPPPPPISNPTPPSPISHPIQLRRPRQSRLPIRPSPNLHILLLLLPLRLRLRSLALLKALLEIRNDIIDMFGADGDADEVFRDAGVDALGFGELFVGGGPGVDG